VEYDELDELDEDDELEVSVAPLPAAVAFV